MIRINDKDLLENFFRSNIIYKKSSKNRGEVKGMFEPVYQGEQGGEQNFMACWCDCSCSCTCGTFGYSTYHHLTGTFSMGAIGRGNAGA